MDEDAGGGDAEGPAAQLRRVRDAEASFYLYAEVRRLGAAPPMGARSLSRAPRLRPPARWRRRR